MVVVGEDGVVCCVLCVCVVWWCCCGALCGVGEALLVFACVRAIFVFCLSPASVLCFVLVWCLLAPW